MLIVHYLYHVLGCHIEKDKKKNVKYLNELVL